jgi:hypothetical protein
VGSDDSLIPQENIIVFLAPLLSSNYFLALLSLLVYIPRIAMLEYDLELRVQNFLFIESLGTLLGTRGESWASRASFLQLNFRKAQFNPPPSWAS